MPWFRRIFSRSPAPWWAHHIARGQTLIMADLSKLQASTDALTTEVANLKTQDASIKAYVQGVPGLVSAAVADALASAQNEGTIDQSTVDALQAKIDDSVSGITDSTNDVLNAISANTPVATSTSGAAASSGSGDLGNTSATVSTGDTPAAPDGTPAVAGSAAVVGDGSALAPGNPETIASPSPFGVNTPNS